MKMVVKLFESKMTYKWEFEIMIIFCSFNLEC